MILIADENNSFNKSLIPRHDDTLHATSRRYGLRTMPNTHPANHAHYAPNETTFRASFINPKRHPSQVYRSRDPSRDFSKEKTLNIHSHVTDKTNLNGPRQVLINNCSGYVMNSTLWDSTSWAIDESGGLPKTTFTRTCREPSIESNTISQRISIRGRSESRQAKCPKSCSLTSQQT